MTGDTIHIADLKTEDLQRRLADRELLVEELTSRLEQAAEQLDRLRRSGADRGGRGLGGIPAELVEQQQTLTEELQNAVQQWEEMQPAELLARVEMHVIELRDLVVDRLNNAALSFPATATSDPGETAKGDTPKDASKSARQKEKASGLSSYEAFKAGLLDSAELETPHDPEPQEDPAASEPAERKGDHKPHQSQPAEIPIVDPPAAVDFDTATTEDFRTAVDQRDSYITYLIRRLRALESSQRPARSWSELEDVPDELRSRLEEHEQNLQESLRLAEVETSVERARLGREAARLDLLSEQLRRKAVQLGMVDEDSEVPCVTADDDVDQETAKKNGRWFRLFGK